MFWLNFRFKKLNKSAPEDIFMSGSGQLVGRNFDQARKLNWTEESYSQGNRAINIAKSVKPKTIFFLATIMFFCLGIIAARTFFLQALRGQEYYVLASKNSIREIRLPAERGLIYDRNDSSLVSNVPTYTLLLDTRALGDKISIEKEKIVELASALHISPEDLLEVIDKFKKYPGAIIPIKTNLAYEEALRLDVELGDRRGLSIVVDSKRDYLESAATPSLSHILGFIGKINAGELKEYKDYLPQDSIGKTGIERFYEKVLRGQIASAIKSSGSLASGNHCERPRSTCRACRSISNRLISSPPVTQMPSGVFCQLSIGPHPESAQLARINNLQTAPIINAAPV